MLKSSFLKKLYIHVTKEAREQIQRVHADYARIRYLLSSSPELRSVTTNKREILCLSIATLTKESIILLLTLPTPRV